MGKINNSRVIVFLENTHYTILIDQNSNALTLMFEFLSMFYDVTKPPHERIHFTFKVSAGQFAKRDFFKFELVSFTEEMAAQLASFIDSKLLMYAD